MSKSWRLVKLAEPVLVEMGFAVDILDLSRLTSEFGRQIHPCKSCVSTAMPLCHWPCSCYPNYSLGQTDDWMNEIYPLLGRGARHPDRDAGELVSRLDGAEGDDGPSGLRRRRQSRSDVDARQARRPGQGARTERLALSAPSGRAAFRARRARRQRGRRDAAPLAFGLADRHVADLGGPNQPRPKAMSATWSPTRPRTRRWTRTATFQDEVLNAARALGNAVKLARAGKFENPAEGLAEPNPK